VPQLYRVGPTVLEFYEGQLRAQIGILQRRSKTVVLKLRPALNCACSVSLFPHSSLKNMFPLFREFSDGSSRMSFIDCANKIRIRTSREPAGFYGASLGTKL
jgi:hypothetical protein